MIFHQLFILLLLIILLFFPIQIDARIPYIIGGSALLCIPFFVKNLKEDIQNHNKITLFFIVFLLACSFSTIFSIDQKRSLVQLMLYFSYFIIFTSIRSILPTYKSKLLFVRCYLFVVSILSLISLYNTLILHFVNRENEGVSFLWIYYGHNHLSALLIFAIPISLYFLKTYWDNRIRVLSPFAENSERKRSLRSEELKLGDEREVFSASEGFRSRRSAGRRYPDREVGGASLFFTCYALLVTFFFTFGLGSMISLAISFLITLLLFKKSLQTIKIHSIILCIVLGFLASLSLFFFSTHREAKGVGIQKDTRGSMETRFIYWQNGFDNFKKRPVTGSGLDTFRIINDESRRKSPIGSYYSFNFFLQMLSDTGIVGFLSSVLLIGSILWSSFKKIQGLKIAHEKLLALAFFVGMFASTLNSMVDFDWQLPTAFLLFWILAGFLLYA